MVFLKKTRSDVEKEIKKSTLEKLEKLILNKILLYTYSSLQDKILI